MRALPFGQVRNFIMPPLASWFIYKYDWRTSYVIVGALVLVIVISATQFLRRDPSQTGQLPDGEHESGERGLKSRAEGFSLREAADTRQFWIVFTMFFCVGFFRKFSS